MSPDALQAAPAPAAQKPAAPDSQVGYVGSDTCEACHTEGESLKGTPHAMAMNPRTPAATQGCESCHGPGQAHVDDENKGHIKKFKEMTPAAVSETCLTCHNRGTHAGWEGSKHEQRNLTCTTCHSVHSPTSPEKQLV